MVAVTLQHRPDLCAGALHRESEHLADLDTLLVALRTKLYGGQRKAVAAAAAEFTQAASAATNAAAAASAAAIHTGYSDGARINRLAARALEQEEAQRNNTPYSK